MVRRETSRLQANGAIDDPLIRQRLAKYHAKVQITRAKVPSRDEVDGKRVDEMPMTQTEFHHAKPVYEYFDGWKEDISGCRSFDDLPKNAQVYVRALEEMSGAPFWAVGVGPGREQTVILRDS